MKNFFSTSRIAGLAVAASLLCASTAYGHSVGQVQSTKYFDPDTVKELTQKIQSGQPTLQVGDSLSYILQFTPIGNGAITGVAGYVTDYLPPGVVVTNAEFVTPSGSSFTRVTPNLPGGIDGGWGTRGQNTYGGVFNTSSYDPTGRCAQAAPGLPTGYGAKCNGRLSELHADTGIFYSEDPRTAQFPGLNVERIAQGTNGYYVNPTGGGNLNGFLSQTDATTHNLWDAIQTNAFGTSALPTLTPKSSQAILITAGNVGQGAAPYFAGSPVAGPDTGYQLDASGEVGPWYRIAYPGSRIGDASTGPAPNSDGSTTTIGGMPTTLGWGLSAANPLPPNTNAIRWAVGKLEVGRNLYARVTVKLTAPAPASGLINSFEVFGGDAGDANGGKDNPWRYHVPSVADTNSSMLVVKEVTAFCSATSAALAAACTPVDTTNGGAIVPKAFIKFRYRITYLNTSNTTQTNVQISDILPFDPVNTLRVGNIYILSGTDIRPAKVGTLSLSSNTAAVGAARGADVLPTILTTNNVQQIALYSALPTLSSGSGGAVEIDVVVNEGAVGNTISNKAKATSNQVTGGVTSIASSAITNTASLSISKTTSTPSLTPGGTATYTITVTNAGNAAATDIIVRDFLPFIGTTDDATRRFSLTGTPTISGIASVVPTSIIGPTVSGYTANTNQQQVTWNFGAAPTLAVGASFTITFNATVGSNMPASATAYTNDVRAGYNTSQVSSLTLAAPITLSSPLQVTKSIDCVYNTAGTVCTGYTGSGVVPVNAKVRFKLNYSATTAQTNVLLCDQLTSSQSSPAFTATIAAPTIAPTPSGPYTNTAPPNGPPAGGLTVPAVAACGLPTSGVTFSFPAIPVLAAGASGTVYYDAITNAANSSTLTNTGKVVSTENPGGSLNTVAVSARDKANLVITKTTSTPTISVNGIASYRITVTNTGNISATDIRIHDELPFIGTTLDATRRFSYVANSSSITGMTSVAPSLSVAPTQSPYSSNVNQQEVLWNFGTQTLAPGATFTINFQAQAGINLLAGSTTYPNTVLGIFSSGPDTAYSGTTNTALVTIPTNLSITKTIECIYSGTSCLPYDNTGIVPVNAKLRYKMHYMNSGTTAQTNVYICDKLPTQIGTYAAAVSNITSSPAIGTPVSPANALCGLVSPTTFSYPVIASLAAGAMGDVFYDVQTTAASSNNIVNTGKIVSAQAPAGETSAILATAYDVTKLSVSKTTTTPALITGATATYTISVMNTGNIATTSLKIRDFLPYSGTVVEPTKRFNYATTTLYTGNGATIPTVTAIVEPTVAPYSNNPNQQQVTWDFGNFALAAGATVTITFTATVGSAMPNANYGNTAFAEYTSSTGSGNNSVNNAAVIATTRPVPALTFLKTVQVLQDPINGTTDPKYIPGADALYTLTVTNSGTGPADNNTLVIYDAIPVNTELFVGNLSAGAPYGFTPGGSTLSCVFTALNNTADCIDFSSDALAVTDPAKNWAYVPVGTYDPLVKHVRFKLVGAMASNATPPSFNLTIRVKVK